MIHIIFSIIEICGLTSTGKSRLVNVVALNLAQYHMVETLYVDTKNDFCANRLTSILLARKCENDKLLNILSKIKYKRVYDFDECLSTLEEFRYNNYQFYGQIKLLIIDALPGLFGNYHSGSTHIARRLLSEIGILLKRIKQLGIIIILVNLAVKNDADDGKISNKSFYMYIFINNFTIHFLLKDAKIK